jgi:hypothetical protein
MAANITELTACIGAYNDDKNLNFENKIIHYTRPFSCVRCDVLALSINMNRNNFNYLSYHRSRSGTNEI